MAHAAGYKTSGDESEMSEEQAKAAGPKPEIYVPLSEINAICKRIMKDTAGLTNDSEDYRIGQWSGAEKAMYEIGCVAELHPERCVLGKALALVQAE
jgi:hypothetical protein